MVMSATAFGADSAMVSTSLLIFAASALFAFVTVFLSCFRPGRIASKVSPVEAVKYTQAAQSKKKSRTTRGAKVHQMALTNLGRNKSKTVLVLVSLALSVVLLNVLFTFTGGFDMEKYLENTSCADFVVSSTDYFRHSNNSTEFISKESIDEIKENTTQTTAG